MSSCWKQQTGADQLSNAINSVPQIKADLVAARRRLEMDASAGIAPPEEELSHLIASFEASPLADAEQFAAWQKSSCTGDARNGDTSQPAPTWKRPLTAALRKDILPEMDALRIRLQSLNSRWSETGDLVTLRTDFYPALIASVSSDATTPETCFANATRRADELESVLRSLIVQRYLPDTDQAKTVTSEKCQCRRRCNAQLLSVKNFREWAAASPLFPPEPEAEPSEEADSEYAKHAVSRACPPNLHPIALLFTELERSMEHLNADIAALTSLGPAIGYQLQA